MFSQKDSNSIGILGVYKHSKGINGYYYGLRTPSYITLVANMGSNTSKDFKALSLVTQVNSLSGDNLPFKTFDEIEVWNKEQYTGLVDIVIKENAFQKEGILETLTSRIKNSFRLSIHRNIVANPNLSIFEPSNHLQLKKDLVPTKWLDKIKGNYINIKLINLNNEGTLKLEDASILIAENNR
jgi:hypothetical protein